MLNRQWQMGENLMVVTSDVRLSPHCDVMG